MDAKIEGRLRAVRAEVHQAHIHPDRRDALQRMLDRAEECANGAADKTEVIAQAMGELIVHVVRVEAREGDRVTRLIAEHSAACTATRLPRSLRDVLQQVAQQYPVLTLILLLWLATQGLNIKELLL